MALLPILTIPDVRLTTRCQPVGAVDDALRQLADDMLQTMYAAPGRGLAAPQIGVLSRLFVMDVTWKEGVPSPVVMVNPDLIFMSENRATGPEACLSIPGLVAQVSRASEIRMVWTDLEGALHDEVLTGMAAICAQHEYDHLDGVLTLDRLTPEERALAQASAAT